MTKTAAAEPVAWVLRGGLKNLASGSHDWVQVYNDKTKDGDMVPLYTVPLNAAPGYCPHCKQYTIEEPLPAAPAPDPYFLGLAQTLLAALKRLSFAAQTACGTAGRDDELVAAIAQAENAIKEAHGRAAAPAPDDDSLTIAYLMGYEDCRSGMEKRKWAQKVEAAMKDQP